MRILDYCGFKWDKRYFFAFIIAFLCAIICGIVLCKTVNINIYIQNYAADYVYYVFNFQNSKLIFTRIILSAILLYIFFCVSYFTNLKYLLLILVYLRGLLFGNNLVLIISSGTFGGVLVSLCVYIPATLISIFLCYFVCESCKGFNKKYAFAFPLVLVAVDAIIYILLINVVFRIVVIIV